MVDKTLGPDPPWDAVTRKFYEDLDFRSFTRFMFDGGPFSDPVWHEDLARYVSEEQLRVFWREGHATAVRSARPEWEPYVINMLAYFWAAGMAAGYVHARKEESGSGPEDTRPPNGGGPALHRCVETHVGT